MNLITFETALLAKEKNFKKFQSLESVNGEFFYYDTHGNLNSNYYNKESQSGSRSNSMLNDPIRGAIHSNSCEAPYQYELLTWLRNVHEIRLFVIPSKERYTYFIVLNNENISLYDSELNPSLGQGDPKTFETYEDALESGLQSSLKLI